MKGLLNVEWTLNLGDDGFELLDYVGVRGNAAKLPAINTQTQQSQLGECTDYKA